MNVAGVETLLKVLVIGVDSPPPEGVTVIVPLYTPFGVIVKVPEVELAVPPVGPVRVYEVA